MGAFTVFHVILSLLALAGGVIVAYEMVGGKFPTTATHFYMITTIGTLLTGFMFPFNGFTPAIGVGILCTLIFIPTALGFYTFHMQGAWKKIYIIGSIVLFYFNSFVLVAQLFQKIPAFHELAPTGKEPAFLLIQGLVFVFFIILGFVCVRGLRRVSPQAHA